MLSDNYNFREVSPPTATSQTDATAAAVNPLLKDEYPPLFVGAGRENDSTRESSITSVTKDSNDTNVTNKQPVIATMSQENTTEASASLRRPAQVIVTQCRNCSSQQQQQSSDNKVLPPAPTSNLSSSLHPASDTNMINKNTKGKNIPPNIKPGAAPTNITSSHSKPNTSNSQRRRLSSTNSNGGGQGQNGGGQDKPQQFKEPPVPGNSTKITTASTKSISSSQR